MWVATKALIVKVNAALFTLSTLRCCWIRVMRLSATVQQKNWMHFVRKNKKQVGFLPLNTVI